MPSETLLPCPFCGGEAARNTTRYSENCDTVKANGGQTLFHGVNCIVCGARTSTVVGYRTPGEADAAWNRRAHDTQAPNTEQEHAD